MSANPKGNPGASIAVWPAVKSIGNTIVSIVETTTYEKDRGDDSKTSLLKNSYTNIDKIMIVRCSYVCSNKQIFVYKNTLKNPQKFSQ